LKKAAAKLKDAEEICRAKLGWSSFFGAGISPARLTPNRRIPGSSLSIVWDMGI
jgi:hypothetical protein